MELEENNIKICRVTLKVLHYSLMWPRKKYELTGSWNYVKIAFFFLILVPWCSTVIMHLVMAFKNDLNMSEDVALTCCFCGLSYMIFAFVKNQPKTASLLRDLSNFKKFGMPPGFANLDKTLNFGSLCAYLYTALGIVAYCSAKTINQPECKKISNRNGVKEICGLPTAVWIPIDVNYFPIFQLVYFYIFVSMQMFLKAALMISYMVLEITHHMVLRIKHLEQLIFDCFRDEQDCEIQRKQFAKCILYHKEILEFARRTNDCFSADMFAHLAMTAAICGCLQKQFIDVSTKVILIDKVAFAK
ncbi:hypothetical protein Zmor_024102 [Zophobas morio]|uniref:Odorant receptor n=1 Tax=Zophobas morio TaxID=2755281 RepID=A0AA38I095_9CUCU|nr:hypothetical protein Zmor_024102 [Zophobas morio]